MKKLLDFLIKYNYWLLFVLLEAASFTLLFRFNRYQQGVFFTTANVIAGKIYETEAAILSYFSLNQENRKLVDQNLQLELQVSQLQSALIRAGIDSVGMDSLIARPLAGIRLIKGEVVHNSLTRRKNFLTLDRGSSDGVRSGLGVVGSFGVIGIVYLTSAHYSVVIPLLNTDSRISCKIAGTDYFGTLSWDGRDARYAYLEGIPRHAKFRKGGQIVTSGYSEVFPAGLPVGRIGEVTTSDDGLSYRLQVILSTDFGNLSEARVIERTFDPELHDLQEEAEKSISQND
ncbi:MAG: rod shape-determining protein MreC [Bacteroidaceae bacterium]|jgi:rod shape-determining protein MreC